MLVHISVVRAKNMYMDILINSTTPYTVCLTYFVSSGYIHQNSKAGEMITFTLNCGDVPLSSDTDRLHSE